MERDRRSSVVILEYFVCQWRVARQGRWEGSEVGRWERWEVSEVRRWGRWEGSEKWER